MSKILAGVSIVLLLIVLFNISKFVSPNFNLANAYMYIAWLIALLLFYIILNKKTLYCEEAKEDESTQDESKQNESKQDFDI